MDVLLPNLIAIAAATAICVRLLLFRRRHRRYRCGVAVIAWLLINASGIVALHLLLSCALGQSQAGWGLALLLLIATVPVFGARGNVAKLTRPPLWF